MTPETTSVLIVAFVIVVVLLVQLLQSRRAAARQREDFAEETNRLQEELAAKIKNLADLKQENTRLSKWVGIADADAKAAEMLSAARTAMEMATANAAVIRGSAERQAAELTGEARNRATALTSDSERESKALREQARTILESATAQARSIQQSAEKKAEEIAGSAYEALKNAALYEQTVKAMKNIIEGYGDQYMIAERSLLDGLAEEFGYKEAGGRADETRARLYRLQRRFLWRACLQDWVDPAARTS